MREVIERRGDISETVLSPWFAFEVADGLTTIFLRDRDSAELRDGLELLGSFCARIAPDVLRTGDLASLEVGKALFGAAVEQLASLAGRTGVSPTMPEGDLMGRPAGLPVLDREHRLFDAARIRLWLAEEAGGRSPDLDEAAATFDELGAHPYREHASRLGG